MNMYSQDLLAISFCVGLIAMVQFAVMKVNKKIKGIKAFSIGSYFYALIYGVVPIYFIINRSSVPEKIAVAYGTNVIFLVTFLAFAGYIALLAGYGVGVKTKIGKHREPSEELPLAKYEKIAFLTFFIGMVGVFAEVYLQGGILNALNNIELVRGFKRSDVKDGANNPIVFLRMFKPFIIFSFYLFYMMARYKPTVVYRTMALFTFAITLYIVFLNGGRTHIVILLATVIIGFLMTKHKEKKRSNKEMVLWSVIVVIGIISIIVLDPIFAYLSYGRPISFEDLGLASLMQQFSFPFSNMLFVLSNDNYSFRYMQDFFLWIISLSPAFVLSKIGIRESEPLYVYNTVMQNNTMILGGIPSDILTLGYYQLGIAGVLFTIVLFGFILGQIDRLIASYNHNYVLMPIIIRVAIYMGMIVMYADLESIFRVRYDVILLLLVLIGIQRYRIIGRTDG